MLQDMGGLKEDEQIRTLHLVNPYGMNNKVGVETITNKDETIGFKFPPL